MDLDHPTVDVAGRPLGSRCSSSKEAADALGIHRVTLGLWRQRGAPYAMAKYLGSQRPYHDIEEVRAWATVRGYAGTKGSRTKASRMREQAINAEAAARGAAAVAPPPAVTAAAAAPPVANSEAGDLAAAISLGQLDPLDPAALHAAVQSRRLSDAERAYLTDLLDVAKQRKETAVAEQRELMNSQRRGELVERSRVIECWEMVAGEFRRATETLQRQFGRDAFEVIDAALDRSAAALARAIAVRGGAVDDSGGEGGEPAEGVEPVEEGIEA